LYTAYLIAATAMTLNVLEGHSLIASFFKCDISYLWRVARSLCICRSSGLHCAKSSKNEESILWQHAIQQHVRFHFFLHQFRSSVLNNVLQIVGVLLQLMYHAPHHVKLPTTCKVFKIFMVKSTIHKIHTGMHKNSPFLGRGHPIP